MIDASSSLPELLDHAWGMLVRGGADKKHPYQLSPSLATYGPRGIQQRIVVLRDVMRPARLLRSYSDVRTQKVADLQQQPTAHWLFYDHGSKEQLRVQCQVLVHHQDALARALWNDIPPKGRGDYVGPVAPGTHTSQYTDNLPTEFSDEPTEENTSQGFDNFAVLDGEVMALDFLKLRRDGHLRAQFQWQESEWVSRWTAP